MGLITKTKTWADNENVLYTDLNSDFDSLYNEVNGNLDDANIKSSANISPSKVAGTAVTLTATQSLSNKTLVKPTVSGSLQTITTDIDASTITFDMTSSNFHKVTLGGNRTFAVSNVSVGQFFYIRITQDSTGGRTVTWFSTSWNDSTAPTLTTTASKTDLFAFVCTGTNTFDGFVVGQNIG